MRGIASLQNAVDPAAHTLFVRETTINMHTTRILRNQQERGSVVKTLVIGGTGLIGSHAAQALYKRGHDVTVMARRPPVAGEIATRCRYIPGDYLQAAPPADILAGVDGLVFATGLDWRIQPASDPSAYFDDANVESVARTFRAAAAAGVKRGVLVSSYYHVVRPDLHNEPYIRSRLRSEDAVFEAAGPQMNICAVEPSWVMGPTLGIDTSFGETITKLVRGAWPPIAIPGGTNWVSARSLGFAIAEALEHGRDRARYLVGDENRSWAEVIGEFARHAGNSRSVLVLPMWLLKSLGWAALVRRRLKGKQSGWDERKFISVITDRVYFEECSGRELNYPRQQIDTAIQETYAACSAHAG